MIRASQGAWLVLWVTLGGTGLAQRSAAVPPLVQARPAKYLVAEDDLHARVAAAPLAAYVKELLAMVERVTKEHSAGNVPTAVTFTVAVRPDGARRIWMTPEKSSKLAPQLRTRFESELAKVKAPSSRGMVLFQLPVQLWHGAPKGDEAFPSAPEEWLRLVQQRGERMDVETLAQAAWNAPPASGK